MMMVLLFRVAFGRSVGTFPKMYDLLLLLSRVLCPKDMLAQTGIVLNKVGVHVNAAICSATDSRKAIEIELTTETFVLGLVKILGHDSSKEFTMIMNFEGRSIQLPRYHLRELVAISIL